MWGSLGNIVFETVKTPDKESFKRKKKYNYAEINTYQKPKLQYIGDALEEIEFEIKLVKTEDLDPEEELEKIYQEAEKGEPLTLSIGSHIKGDFVITSVEETLKATDRKGNLAVVYLKLKLKEYN